MSEAEQAPALDLSSALPLESFVLDILHQGTGQPTGWKIELAGPAHPKTVALGKELSRERLTKEARVEAQMANGRKVKPEIEDPDERARRNVASIVARIIGWSPNPIVNSISTAPIAFSEKAAIDMLLRPEMAWVLGQIAEYLASERAFTQGSALS